MRNALYEKIYQTLVGEIKTGRLPAGTKLPSIRKYSEENGISLNTVQSAYNLLLSEGYVYAREKSGYYVATFETSLIEEREKPEVEKKEAVQAEEMPALLDLSANLIDSSSFPYSTLRQLYREALSGRNNEILEKHGDNRGDEELRSAITRFVYQHRGVVCTPDQVVVGNGTLFHMEFLARLFGKEASFLMETPGFHSNLRILQNYGTKVQLVQMDEEGVSMEEVRALTSTKSGLEVLHVTPSHQYPKGITMSAPRRSSLLKWAYEEKNRYIIEDDYDSDFRYNGHPIPSLSSMDTQGRVIFIGTFSRTLTPSMRVSYMILPMDLLCRYRESFGYYPCPVSRIDQKVIAEFMAGGYYERHISRMRRIYRTKRNLMVSLLSEALPELEIQGSEAGLHFIIRHPSIREESLLVEKGKAFGLYLKGAGDGWLIVGYAHLSEEEMTEAVEKLRALYHAFS